MLLFHRRLDVGVAGAPHDAVAAVLGDVVVETARALHLADDGGTGLVLEDLPGKERQQAVAREHVALVVHAAETVYIAIETDAQIGLVLLDGFLEVAQILLACRVGMVVGKVAVHVAEKRNDFATKLLV